MTHSSTIAPFGWLKCLGLAAGLGVALAAPPAAAAPPVFDEIAGELLTDLRNADVSRIAAVSGYGRPTLRIRAFRENEAPIPKEFANAWNRRLLRALQRRSRSQFEFVEETAVATLIREIERTTPPGAERDKRVDALRASSRADVLIVGTVILSGRTPVLSYQAVSVENGRILASSAPRRMPFPGSDDPPAPLPAASAPSPAPMISPPAPSTQSHARTDVFGYRRTVEEAEALLAELGYDPGEVDGVITSKTREALRAYQLDSALPVHGRMTRRTVENMRRDKR